MPKYAFKVTEIVTLFELNVCNSMRQPKTTPLNRAINSGAHTRARHLLNRHNVSICRCTQRADTKERAAEHVQNYFFWFGRT